LRAALYAAREQKTTVRSEPIPIALDGKLSEVVLHLRVSTESQQEGFFLVIFDEYEISDHQPGSAKNENTGDAPRIQELETELSTTKQRLQIIIEEYETSQEEMKASSEEMQSNNEELRSTLEELETSKEELQSMNEELSTVNLENRHKVKELAQLSGDLQNLLTATDIATLFLDRDLRIMRFTPQVSELFNIRVIDRGRPLAELSSRLTGNGILKNAQEVLDKLTPHASEIKDERGQWYLTRLLPYRSTEDRIEGVVITFVNITQLKQAEEDVRHSEEQFRALVEASSQMVWTTNAEGEVTEDSLSWRNYTGQTFQEFKAGGLLNAVHPDDRQRAQETWQQAIKTGNSLLTEYRVYHVPTQDYQWTTVRAVPLRKADDTIRGWVGMNVDITQQKRSEKNLRRAKEEAEQAAKAKGDFLALMSHEIRTPLNAILGIANLLLDKNPQPQQLENLQTLKFSADNLRMLINDILDFSKIEAGKVSVEETDLNLPALLHSLEKAYEPIAQEKGNTLKFNLDERIPTAVRTDSLKLSQILNNLISNAVKFTQNGTITLNVSLQRKKRDKYLVTFSVEDTGIGISADKLDIIFDNFSQADISTVRQYGGTGLGLSITKLLLELMDSRIALESEEGKGSCFFFTLPLEEGATDTAAVQSLVSLTGDSTQLAQVRMLLVEDAPVNRMMLIQLLQEWWNLTPDIAENGKQAVEIAQQAQRDDQPYHLILMDIRMPVMDGYQAARLIRELPNYTDTPIFALTADTPEEVKKHPEASCFQEIIIKPFNPPELQQKILRYVQKYSLAQPTQPESPSISEKEIRGLNLQKVSELFKDEKERQQFMENAINNIKELQSQFTQAMSNRDASALDEAVHKSKLLLDMLQLTHLQNLLGQSQRMLKVLPNDEALQEIQSQVEDRLEEVFELLR
ncbi:MAG: PAS domain-containing protein, partial [Tunicatimonas sp.]|uniref:PAS domain-containing protein n=1 Tax=Tunicatimonas sp. TaxID=1940096 RepID=UPI003C70C016